MKKIMILGASGNIGEQALTVLKNNNNFELVAFSVGQKINKIKEILDIFPTVKAICVCQGNKKLFQEFSKIKFYVGDQGLIDLIDDCEVDLVLNALVGFTGLAPTLAIIKKNIDIALANKESLVVGGELVNSALRQSKSKIYPVDSEHSAIYKCLQTCDTRDVDEILITASGGAFRNLSREDLKNVTPRAALQHPTWKMGPKVTIDSASMLNKGFEVIEAYYLFNFPLNKIKILMHDESYVHSVVHLKDGTYLGEVNAPTMLNPISYAINNKQNPQNIMHVHSIEEFGPYHFHTFDIKRYPMVAYAMEAIKQHGIIPCVLNAVDEIAVEAFLNGKISFLKIEDIVKQSLTAFTNIEHPSLITLIDIDKKARNWALNIINQECL